MVALLAGRTQRACLQLTSHEFRGISVVTDSRVVIPGSPCRKRRLAGGLPEPIGQPDDQFPSGDDVHSRGMPSMP